MSDLSPNFYVVLGVTPGATPDEIRQAYRLRARELHPDARPGDAGESDERFSTVAEAYHVLSTPELRLAYDMQLHMEAATDVPAAGRLHGVGAPAEPTLALRLVPGVDGIGQLTEPTRFYLLGELLPAHVTAHAWSAPLNLAVLVDRSSSMRGIKLFEAKRAVKALFGRLGVDDRLTLLLFDDRPEVLLDSATPVGAAGAEMALDNASPRGGTQLSPALEIALNHLEMGVASGRIAALLLITDGRTYGDEERCVELAQRARLLGVPIISFGLGLEWNRDLLDRIAAMSGGVCSFVEEPATLSDLLDDATRRLRATLAANIRLSLEPGPGVGVLHASTIAPEITDVFDGAHLPGEPVEVKLGALTSQPPMESVVALWELLLDPLTLTEDSAGLVVIGAVTANWSLTTQNAAFASRLNQRALVPHVIGGGMTPLAPEARLALELLTAYRLHVRADQLATAGASTEAAIALTTSALRLRSAGDGQRADEAQQAASSLLASLDDGLTATLRAKYSIRNLSMFHQLRRNLRARLAPAEEP